MMHPYIGLNQWVRSGNEPEPLGEVDYATLPPPLVAGNHDRPSGRSIVSERIGGTAQRVVGPAE